MLKVKGKCVIGIDLAGLNTNPTGWALLKEKTVKTTLLYTNEEIFETTIRYHPALIAIDAPLSLPKKDMLFRKVDREMIRKCYRVLPPNLPP